MKKNNHFVLGSIIVSVVSYLCLKGMKAIDKKLEKENKKD